uniref:Uncharacterized protein n=1 Tax=Glycine max TaxID=3847 RepID=C6SW28_SOYBN|nr:unknown [Glycine max]
MEKLDFKTTKFVGQNLLGLWSQFVGALTVTLYKGLPMTSGFGVKRCDSLITTIKMAVRRLSSCNWYLLWFSLACYPDLDYQRLPLKS